MSKKEIRKRCQELIYLGMKGIFTSEGYKEYKELTDKLPNKALLHIVVYILGTLFTPRLLLLYCGYIFIRFATNFGKMIWKIEEEENIKIL